MLFSYSSRVIHGDHYGRKIGFPTINLDRLGLKKASKLPKNGVYRGFVKLNGHEYRAGIIWGVLDRKGLPKVEAHLIGYDGNAYGQRAEIFFEKFLRPYRKFKTEAELIAQIKKDLIKCK